MKFNTVYMENILEKYKIQIIEFFTKYKNILLISIFTGIFVNAIDIFTIKFGIDAEMYSFYGIQPYIDLQRYGSIILYYLFPFARFHIVSQLTGIIALTFAALLTISRHNISNTAKLLFVLLFITYPSFTFLQYFYFQSAYNFIGLLFVVIGYRLIETGKNIFIYIPAGILLLIGISSYQSNFAVFLTVMMINVILDYISDKNYKKAIISILKYTFILVLAVIVYYIFVLIYASHFNSYYENIFMIFENSLFVYIREHYLYLKDIVFSRGLFYGTANNTYTYLLLITTIVYLAIFFKSYKERLFFIIFLILFLLAIFSLNFIINNNLALRAYLAIAFYCSFIALLFWLSSTKKIIKTISIILTLCTVMYHCYYIVQYQTAYVIQYEQDKTIALDLISNIKENYPQIYNGNYKIVFAGKIHHQQKHPLIILKETFGGSFFEWDNGNTARICAFLKLFGLPYNIKSINPTAEMQETINRLSAYPDKNCIGLYKDTIIVKLR